ncbi:hypothetical protein [Methylocaldum sp.]|uniref:hypothetical protein n=1 Tax=Methylocaldum sp. TaxID=1969727 RepID=UPI002D48FC40|nr:hypothetical protein [Methylocaldum sp.]HYE34017.1 hypothetical protein [Methylocaldum sp.]
MATIRKRSNGTFQVQIRLKGNKPLTGTFSTKDLAQKWAKKIESEIEQGTYRDHAPAQETIFKEVCERYLNNVLPSKKSVKQTRSALGIILEHLGDYSLARLSTVAIADYR